MSAQAAISPPLARALIRSLTRGTAIVDGVRHLHVGHERWLAAQAELLDEVSEDGHAETKFVRGAYGAGKSHFLTVVQDRARDTGWMTSHVECKHDGVQIDRFETLYPQVVAKLSSREFSEARRAPGGEVLDPIRGLLDLWTSKQLKAARIKEGALTRPFDGDNRIYDVISMVLVRTNLLSSFVTALLAYARASYSQDIATTTLIVNWLRGQSDAVALPERYTVAPSLAGKATGSIKLRAIGKSTAHDVMRGLLWLVRAAGYRGLVLCVDEVEELAHLGSMKRQDQALQALREYVDHAGGDGGYTHMCMYLAATPEMFESPQYFPRYDALATRIQNVSSRLNWRAPIVDLERTPLTQDELAQVGRRISDIHAIAYPGSLGTLSSGLVDDLVVGVLASRVRIAKPRLLARAVVDELERARQEGQAFSSLAATEILERTALALADDAEGAE